MNDLWSEASRDVEAENYLRALTAAKLDSAGEWQFLALSKSAEEYEHRKELALDNLFSTALAHGLQLSDLTKDYDRQFKLFMEAKDFTVEIKDDDPDDKGKFGDSDDAPKSDGSDDNDEDESGDDDDKGNPFGKSDDDSDDKGGNTPVTTKPHQKPSDSAVPGDDDGNSDDDSDDDDDSDSDKDDDDKDSGSDDKGGNPFAKGSSRYASLLAKIEAGEDPLRWGRKVADAAPDGDMGDPGQGNDDGMASASASSTPSPGMSSAPSGPSASTAPAGPTTSTAPVTGGGDGGVSSTNGGNQPMMSASGSRTAALVEDIGSYNPHLPFAEIKRLADLALKVADGGDPLTYGDRGGVQDGPISSAVKSAAPPDLAGSTPDSQPGGDSSSDDSDSNSGGGGHSGGGMAAAAPAVAGAAMRMLPMLLAQYAK